MEAASVGGQGQAKLKGEGSITQVPTLVITRYSRQAQFFTEDLGNGVKLEMVQIPSGSFDMGAPEEEKGSRDNERPQHRVTVGSFCMGKYPVTQAQWRAVVALSQVDRQLKSNPSKFKGDIRPVEQISWHDAAEFCKRLSQHTKRSYRLPSEAEWEYACRAGTRTAYHSGQVIVPELANYYGGDRNETTPVGSLDVANAFGLYDMHGNVWEWCADHWHENYEGAPVDGSVWIDDGNQSYRVLRGGSWYSFPEDCRSACRDWDFPDDSNDIIGFRVVCSAARTL